MKYIEEILPCLITMLDFNDKQIKADTCWAFSYITDGPNERIQYVLDVSIEMYHVWPTSHIIFQSGVMSKVVELLHQSADVMILTPALRTAGNIVTGSDSQTEAMINLGLLNVFPKLLRHNKPNIVKVKGLRTDQSAHIRPKIEKYKTDIIFRKPLGQFRI